MAVLQQIDDTNRGSVFPLKSECTVIGRDSHCDLLIGSPAVSRIHARIVAEDTKYYLEDLQSRNGTSLNGRKVIDRELLRDGDQLEFSTEHFVFYSHLSLDEHTSGSSGYQSGIEVASPVADSDDRSIRHEPVRTGDNIAAISTAEDAFRESKVVSVVPVSSMQLTAVASSDATRKLLQGIRLLHSLRRVFRTQDVLDVIMDRLFSFFSAAERVAIVGRSGIESGFRVLAAVGRTAEDTVPVCMPLIQRTAESSNAMLYVDQWRQTPDQQPRLSDMSTRYVICVPLLQADDAVFGVIQMESSRTDRPLDSADLERLVILSQFIAFSLENSLSDDIRQEASFRINNRATVVANRLENSEDD